MITTVSLTWLRQDSCPQVRAQASYLLNHRVSLFAFGSFSSANISEAAMICCFMRAGMILICFVCLERNFLQWTGWRHPSQGDTSCLWRTRIRLPFDTRGCSIQTVWDTSLYFILLKRSHHLLQAPPFWVSSVSAKGYKSILNEDNVINVDKTVLWMNQALIILSANNDNNGLLNSYTSESPITILTNKNNN